MMSGAATSGEKQQASAGSGMPAPLSAEDAHQLLVVRNMLAEATRYAQHATTLQRTTAVVLLDGAVERCTHLVAVARGVEVKRNDGLDDLFSKVRQDLGEDWLPRGMAEVRQLHRARNVAQHEGIGSDREDLPKWARGVTAYVRSLVNAQYGVDVEQLALTDVVRDPSLRQDLQSAAAALESGDVDGCVRRCDELMTELQRRWLRLHSARVVDGSLAVNDRLRRIAHGMGSDPADALRGEVEGMTRLLDLSVFAGTPAQASWFLQIIREPSGVLTYDDASKALAFATNWAIGYEESTSTWVPDRVDSQARAQRLERSGRDETARVLEVVDVTLIRDVAVTLTVRLAGVPDDASFNRWAAAIGGHAHGTPEDSGQWVVRRDGTASVIVDLSVEPEKPIKRLEAALAHADRYLAAQHREKEEKRAQSNAEVAAFEEAICAWVGRPWWIRSVRRDLGTLVIGFDSKVSGTADDGRPGLDKIAALLSRDQSIGSCLRHYEDHSLAIEPIPDPNALIEAMTRIADPVASMLETVVARWQAAQREADRIRTQTAKILVKRTAD
jgi:hypothetical protein